MIYQFQNGAAYALKQAGIQTALRLVKLGAFVAADMTRSIADVYQRPYYDFEQTNQSGVFNNLAQIRFDPMLKYYDNGNPVYTPELDIQVCEIDISKQNNIIRTRIMNEEGTIKEAWSGGDDWSVNISGVLIGDLGVIRPENYYELLNRPNEDTQKLIEITNSLIPITVTCPLLNKKGIYQLVIESIELPHESEWKNLQKFALKCYSHNSNLSILI